MTYVFPPIFRGTAAAIAVSLCAYAPFANAGGVSAGTLIENTASASYDNGSETITVPSNTVSVKVDELLDVTLTSLDPGPISAPDRAT